jgi:hypothetical protein
MVRAGLALLVLLPLMACAPVPVEQAERACLERARLAERPRGEVRIGASSNGQVGTEVDLTISSDYLRGRDPSAVFNACVQQKSGQFPTRALYDQPGWRG